MIEVNNVTKRLGETLAIQRFSVKFQDGISGIVGENGAGKSTLFRLISGIYFPTNGEILIDGHNATDKKAKELRFFLTDDPFSPGFSTMGDMIKFYASMFDLDVDKCRALVAKTELDREKFLSNFSKGMRRQAFLCVALSMKVPYLLLDEAFDGLDPLAMDWIKEEILRKAIEDHTTILIASHNIETLDKLVDRYYLIRKGCLDSTGDIGSFSKDFTRLQCYFPRNVTENDLKLLGAEVVRFKVVGSISEITIKTNYEVKEAIKNMFNPILYEEIPLSPTDILSLKMEEARAKDSEVHHD